MLGAGLADLARGQECFAETVERFGLARGIASLAVQGTNLAGISNNGVIVGFYTDSNAINHGFELTPAR